jgi:hypothetical protein
MRILGSLLIIALGICPFIFRRRLALFEADTNKRLTGLQRDPHKRWLIEWSFSVIGLAISVGATLYLFGWVH